MRLRHLCTRSMDEERLLCPPKSKRLIPQCRTVSQSVSGPMSAVKFHNLFPHQSRQTCNSKSSALIPPGHHYAFWQYLGFVQPSTASSVPTIGSAATLVRLRIHARYSPKNYNNADAEDFRICRMHAQNTQSVAKKYSGNAHFSRVVDYLFIEKLLVHSTRKPTQDTRITRVISSQTLNFNQACQCRGHICTSKKILDFGDIK